jgi:hypothetical protein
LRKKLIFPWARAVEI